MVNVAGLSLRLDILMIKGVHVTWQIDKHQFVLGEGSGGISQPHFVFVAGYRTAVLDHGSPSQCVADP